MSVSTVIRRVHLYAALFMVPWVLVYSVSTIAMNHHMQAGETSTTIIEERPYTVDYTTGDSREAVAGRILEDLDLVGRHGVWGSLENGSIGIHRRRAYSDKLIEVDLKNEKLVVKQESFSMVKFLNDMHRRRGYQLDYFQDDAWSFSVDLFIAAMIFWALSGVWMWWELKVTRPWGTIALASGFGLFVLFLATI